MAEHSSSSGPAQIALGRMAEFNVSTELSFGGQPGGLNIKESFPFSYWVAPENHWITVMASWPTEAAYQWERGFRELKSRFGVFHKKNAEANGSVWDSAAEPWRRIFAVGGQDVFPLSQILEMGWHRKPPYPGVTFPQLEQLEPGKWRVLLGERAGEVFEDVVCACGRKFLERKHLAAHESIAHAATTQHNALGRAIAEGQATALDKNVSGPIAEVLRVLVAQQEQQGAVLATLLAELAAAKAAAVPPPKPERTAPPRMRGEHGQYLPTPKEIPADADALSEPVESLA